MAGQPVRFLPRHHVLKSVAEYAVDPDTGCWNWLRAQDKRGYGVVSTVKGSKQAHIAIYERLRGPVPEGLELDHLCRNHSCVNPDHLEPVTHAVNMQRGRVARLNVAQVQEIRKNGRRIRSTGVRQVAKRYGVEKSTIYLILRGATWKGVTP